MYLTGSGVPADTHEALKWFRKAAKSGNAAAEFNLGLAYLHGTGVPENLLESARWLRKAAGHGSVAAVALLRVATMDAVPHSGSSNETFTGLSLRKVGNSTATNQP
jgi:TPR repeat protein